MRDTINKFLKKYKEMSLPVKAGLWFTMCTVLQKGISFFTVPIFTRIMTTEQYGLYSVFLSWVSVLTTIVGMDFGSCAYINGLSKYETEKEKDELAVSLTNISFMITGVMLVLYSLAPNFWNNFFGMPTAMVFLMFAEVLFAPAFTLWATKQRFNYRYKSLVFATLLHVVANAGLGIILVLNADETNQALARVFSSALTQAVLGVIIIGYFVYRAKRIIVPKYWGHAMRLSLPLLPHGLALTVLSSSDRLMINNMVGATEAAIYSVAYSASMVINLIKLSIVNAMTPWVYGCIKEKKFRELKKTCNEIIVLVLGMAFLFIMFAPEIIWLVGSEEYYSAIYVVPPVAASVFFTFLYSMFSCVEFYYEKTRGIMYASVAAAVLNLALNFVFIRLFGYVAAGYTTMVCYLFLSFMHYRFMKKAVRENLDVDSTELFDMKFIIIVGICVVVSTLIFSLLYAHTIIRYALIVAAFVVIIVKRKYIMGLLKAFKNR